MTDRIQLLDGLGREFERVCAERERTSRASRRLPTGVRARTVVAALGATVLLGGTAYAVPATRATVGSIAGSLAAWVDGGADEAPGRAVAPGDDAPGWLGDDERARDGVRLIAEAEGVGLYVHQVDFGKGLQVGFSLGRGRGITASLESWRERFDGRAVVVLGHSIFGGERGVVDDRGRIPLFGVTTRAVRRVELRYADGPPLAGATGDGGFVLLVDAWRPLREIVAYDGAGQVLGRADVSRYDLRYECEKEPGCPPAASPDRP